MLAHGAPTGFVLCCGSGQDTTQNQSEYLTGERPNLLHRVGKRGPDPVCGSLLDVLGSLAFRCFLAAASNRRAASRANSPARRLFGWDPGESSFDESARSGPILPRADFLGETHCSSPKPMVPLAPLAGEFGRVPKNRARKNPRSTNPRGAGQFSRAQTFWVGPTVRVRSQWCRWRHWRASLGGYPKIEHGRIGPRRASLAIPSARAMPWARRNLQP